MPSERLNNERNLVAGSQSPLLVRGPSSTSSLEKVYQTVFQKHFGSEGEVQVRESECERTKGREREDEVVSSEGEWDGVHRTLNKKRRLESSGKRSLGNFNHLWYNNFVNLCSFSFGLFLRLSIVFPWFIFHRYILFHVKISSSSNNYILILCKSLFRNNFIFNDLCNFLVWSLFEVTYNFIVIKVIAWMVIQFNMASSFFILVCFEWECCGFLIIPVWT